jgi:hypothetical protein
VDKCLEYHKVITVHKYFFSDTKIFVKQRTLCQNINGFSYSIEIKSFVGIGTVFLNDININTIIWMTSAIISDYGKNIQFLF